MIQKSEWWPVYDFGERDVGPTPEHLIDLPGTLYERYKNNLSEFDKIQAELKILYREQEGD